MGLKIVVIIIGYQDKIKLMWFGSKLAHLELIHYFSVRRNETSLEQKRIKSVPAR